MQTAKKHECERPRCSEKPFLIVDALDEGRNEDRSWFWEFLCGIFSSPDLDYSQFEYLETKRTRQEMKRNGLY